VTPWFVACGALLVLLAGTLVGVARGHSIDRVVALKLTSVIVTLLVVALAVATGEPLLLEVALAVVLLTFVGGLAYARFLERWL
jgi:multicomponent Na+:H+ antiporter subunit F